MSPTKTWLIAAALSIVVTAGGLFYLQQERLREFRRLQNHNDQMQAEANRRHLATLAARTKPVSPQPVTAESVSPKSAITDDPVQKPAEYYRNEGNATPLAALQTFAWACDLGDPKKVQTLLHIDTEARPKVEAVAAISSTFFH